MDRTAPRVSPLVCPPAAQLDLLVGGATPAALVAVAARGAVRLPLVLHAVAADVSTATPIAPREGVVVPLLPPPLIPLAIGAPSLIPGIEVPAVLATSPAALLAVLPAAVLPCLPPPVGA